MFIKEGQRKMEKFTAQCSKRRHKKLTNCCSTFPTLKLNFHSISLVKWYLVLSTCFLSPSIQFIQRLTLKIVSPPSAVLPFRCSPSVFDSLIILFRRAKRWLFNGLDFFYATWCCFTWIILLKPLSQDQTKCQVMCRVTSTRSW